MRTLLFIAGLLVGTLVIPLLLHAAFPHTFDVPGIVKLIGWWMT